MPGSRNSVSYKPTSCLRYGNVDGSQESLLAGFRYGRTEHAIVVLIDHDLGGGIKDCWVADRPDIARQQIMTTAVLDPLVEVAPIGWVRAERILSAALSLSICAEGDDQVTDTSANVGLLRRRVGILNGESWRPAGHRAPTPRRSPAHQDSLSGDAPQTAAGSTALTGRSTAEKSTAKKTARPRSARSVALMQLKVTLAGSKPPIWRRLTVAESTTLERLPEHIQTAGRSRPGRTALRRRSTGRSAGGLRRCPRLPGPARCDRRPRARRRGAPQWAAEALGTRPEQLPAYDPARFDPAEINEALPERSI